MKQIAIGLVGLALAGCGPVRKKAVPAEIPPEAAGVLENLGKEYTDLGSVIPPVYFDFDRAELRAEARQALEKAADLLKKYPKVRIRLDGHCDERGTEEYNLALGDRRAVSVKRYLARLGVKSERLETRSWGEEKPADPGHSEAAWAKNRRVEFLGRIP